MKQSLIPFLPGQTRGLGPKRSRSRPRGARPKGLALRDEYSADTLETAGRMAVFQAMPPCHAASGRRVWEGEHPPISRLGYREKSPQRVRRKNTQ
jgi:hypothetical protein